MVVKSGRNEEKKTNLQNRKTKTKQKKTNENIEINIKWKNLFKCNDLIDDDDYWFYYYYYYYRDNLNNFETLVPKKKKKCKSDICFLGTGIFIISLGYGCHCFFEWCFCVTIETILILKDHQNILKFHYCPSNTRKKIQMNSILPMNQSSSSSSPSIAEYDEVIIINDKQTNNDWK